MKTFTIAALSALAASASAATVTLQETPCIQNNTDLETFTIDTDKLVAKDLSAVCGLKIVSADGVDVSLLTCAAFQDADGKVPGSAKFTFSTPALIATNPVQEAAIRCDTTGSSTTIGTVTITGTASPSQGTGGVIGGNGTTGANGTVVVVTGQPTQTGAGQTGSGGSGSETGLPSTGAGAVVKVGAGAAIAGIAALLL